MHGNGIPIVKMWYIKIKICRLLCAKMLFVYSATFQILQLSGVLPHKPFAGVHPTLTFIDTRTVLHTVHPSASIPTALALPPK